MVPRQIGESDRRDHPPDQGGTDGHPRVVQRGFGEGVEENFSYHSYKHQDRKPFIGSSSLGSNSQPLGEVHHRYAALVMGGGRSIKQAVKAISSAPL